MKVLAGRGLNIEKQVQQRKQGKQKQWEKGIKGSKKR